MDRPVPPPPPPAPASSPPSPAPTRRTPVVAGLTCPSCGGTLGVEEGRTNLLCRYCETPLLVVGERGVARLMVLPEVDREHASRAVRRWFAQGIRKDPRLKREARFQEAFLAFFPFVRVRFDVVGWVLGVVRRAVQRGGKTRWVEEPKEVMVQRSFDRTAAAAEMAEFGVQRVNLAGDRLLSLDEARLRRLGMYFRSQLAPEEVERAVVERSLEEAEAGASMTRVTFSWLEPLRRRVSVVHYPLWVFRYGFRGRTYQALVDAQDGSLAYGKAPGNHLYRALAMVGAAAGTCFVGTTVLQHLDDLARGSNSGTALLGLAVVLVAIAAWGYRQFRHGAVVEEGTGLEPGDGQEQLGAVIQASLAEGRIGEGIKKVLGKELVK